ncbi:MAG: ABC transporter ATP-binding protein [Planctomycetes bacterium]|nr:ABC transporter ATP-binding protein [Planctomycetota bacterium]
MDENKTQSFRRIFKYVWPQWPRLVLVVFAAVLVAILFTLSFMTIGPLLKVMMDEEGMHGWIDRKTCDWVYGLDFYVPDRTDFHSGNDDISYYLRVTNVEEKSIAERLGFKVDDQIIGAGQSRVTDDVGRIPSTKLLEELAVAADKEGVTVQVKRFDEVDGSIDIRGVELVTKLSFLPGAKEADDSFLKETKEGLEQGVNEFRINFILGVQDAISFMPRNEAKANRARSVYFIIGVMAVVTTIRCFATFWQKYMAEKIVQISIAHLREEAFSHVMNMPVGFFSSEGTSDTMSRILGDTATTGKGVKILLGKALREPLKALGTLCGAMIISTKLTLIFLGLAPVTVVLLALLGKKIKKATSRSLISSALMLGKIQDVMRALRVVKVYNRQGRESDDYHQINQQFLRRVLRVAKVEAATGPIMDVLGMIAGSAALSVGVYWIFGESVDMKPSNFFLLLVLLGTTAESIRKVSDVWNKIQSSNAAAERVFAVVDAPSEYERSNAVGIDALKDTIDFKDIVFTYPGNEQPTLNGVTLSVKAGQTIAVVGPNGSGKTTLINLIPRFYDADSGSIKIDGRDICGATLKSLRDQIGMVTQNVVTFNDTVAANIAYGKEDATHEEVVAAAKSSYAHEFIEPLPDGYETMIGEHSSGFSGGQLQRIVIARAIVRNPAILIFDEAMSQIDADSEAKINKALSGLMKGRTCFVIAHRFSTVVSADSIVVMDAGRVAAQGTHSELMESCQLYRNLYETQIVSS